MVTLKKYSKKKGAKDWLDYFEVKVKLFEVQNNTTKGCLRLWLNYFEGRVKIKIIQSLSGNVLRVKWVWIEVIIIIFRACYKVILEIKQAVLSWLFWVKFSYFGVIMHWFWL